MDAVVIQAESRPFQQSSSEPKALPEHLTYLADRRWALWRWVGLRGTGFPAADVLRLSNPECAVAAEQLIEARDTSRRVRSQAIEVVECELKRAQPEAQPSLEKARRRLQKNALPGLLGVGCPAETAIEAFRDASERLDAARNNYERLFEKASRQISSVIREVAGSPAFREAVAWQNRQVLHTAIKPLLRRDPARNGKRSKDHQYEELIARYLQRYCTKNDTIGFFGPVGWARLLSHGEGLIARSGPGLVVTRNVYFEKWCIDEVAKSLAKDQALLQWSTPRLMPFIRIQGGRLHSPSGNPISLSPAEAAILQACNGRQTARQLASSGIRDHSSQLKTEENVYKLLQMLSRQGLIWWELEAEMESHPEVGLRRLLEPIDDDDRRRHALDVLTELDNARAAVAEAAGDAERLDRALESLEATFTRLTDQASTRAHGETYAGRTLIYEDCRRDMEMEIGPDIVSSLGPPLTLLLTSARWLSLEMATTYRKGFEKIYSRLVEKTGNSIIDFVSFLTQAQRLLSGDTKSQLIEAIVSKFQQRWLRVLDIPRHRRRVSYSSDGLRASVLKVFDAAGAGWSYARYHSPDVMIAADSVEAIARGEYELVMGEMHVTANTLAWRLFVEQHPRPEEMFLAIDLDLPEPRLVPIVPRGFMKTVPRIFPVLISPKDFRVELTPSSRALNSQVLPISALVVEDRGKGLVVRTRDGALSFDVIEVFADLLTLILSSHFKILPPDSHTPRIVIDSLVVCRETWHFPASELKFAFASDDAERFIAARRWAQMHNIPRFIFTKVPVEVKPLYVDFDSPIYVEMFAKVIRRTLEADPADQLIRVTEMLPRLDQSWLPGPGAERYTSELRMVALDLSPAVTAHYTLS